MVSTFAQNFAGGAPDFTNSNLWISSTATGSIPAGAFGLNSITYTSDNVHSADGNLISALRLRHLCGGAAGKGSYTGLDVVLNLTQTSGNTSDTGYYTGGQFTVQGSVNDTGILGTPSGHLYGLSQNVRLVSGATFWDQIVGQEIDIGAQSGSSVADIIGMQIVQQLSAVSGSRSNLGFSFNNDSTSNGWDIGISFGAFAGYWPMAAGGTLIGTYAHAGSGSAGTVANGIDFTNVTFTGNAIQTTGKIKADTFTPNSKPTVTGSRGGNAALASFLTGIATAGLITDSTTA